MKKQAKNFWISIAPYIGAVILDIALCGLLVASGRELTPEAIVAITGCIGGLLFMRRRSGDGGTTAGMVLVASTLLMGCGAACQTERAVVDALGTGIDAADELVGPRGGEEYETASWIVRGTQEVGVAAVEACETLRDGTGWPMWLILAVEHAMAIKELIEGASADIDEPAPIELLRAIARIEHELSATAFP